MNPPNELFAGALIVAACALIGWGLAQAVNLVVRVWQADKTVSHRRHR